MMHNNEIAKLKVETTVHEAVHTDSELYKLGAVVTAAFAGGIGLWAVVCLSSAFMSEGPVALFKSFFAVTSGAM